MGNFPPVTDHKYTYSHIGYNLKATDMQAAIGVSQLEEAAAAFIESRASAIRIAPPSYSATRRTNLFAGSDAEQRPLVVRFRSRSAISSPPTARVAGGSSTLAKSATRLLFGEHAADQLGSSFNQLNRRRRSSRR